MKTPLVDDTYYPKKKNYMLMYTAASPDVHSETQRVQMNECREVEHSVGLRLKC